MKHFKMSEFECRCGCEMPADVKQNLEALVEVVLDPARERLGKAIRVTSGYRCEKHNKAVGGAANSQHVKGQAADICAGSPAENLAIAKAIVKGGDWDQMILEEMKPGSLEPRWVHVSWKKGFANRREVRKKVQGTGPVFPKLTAEEMCKLKV